ncbi:tRNA pseudouridine synthase 1 [Thecaphora frezii]
MSDVPNDTIPAQQPQAQPAAAVQVDSTELPSAQHEGNTHAQQQQSQAPTAAKRSLQEGDSASHQQPAEGKRVKVEGAPDRRNRRGRGGSRNGNDKGWERRDRRGTRGDGEGDAAPAEEGGETSGEVRLPKRKVAVKFGYCGIGYSGLQINPGVKTIEGDVFEAFCQAGAVSKDNAVNPNKVGLQRAARTDRGVHAAGNLLSLKLILEPPNLPEGKTLVEHVNDLLPPIIRIWGITRVQNAFNARTSCDSRMYEYLLPTYVFLPPKPGTAMWEMINKMNEDEKAKTGADVESLHEVLDHPFWQAQGTKHDFSADVVAKKQWRMPASQVEHVRALVAKYVGSHNFHNFTIGKEFRDRAAQRFMKALTVSDPKMVNGTEWISIKFHGQSFMYHQIRKMIGLIVLVGRTNAPPSLIPETFGPARIHIPKAPGLGLLLEEPLFGAYNARVELSNTKLDNLVSSNAKKGVTTAHNPEDEKREFVDYAAHKDEMEAFKQKFVYDRIMITEEETSEFAKWLNYLDVFQGPDFEFLNPKGVIPTSAILKVGELRRAPGGQRKGSYGGGTLEPGVKAEGEGEAEGATADQGNEEEEEERAFLNSKDQAEYEG